MTPINIDCDISETTEFDKVKKLAENCNFDGWEEYFRYGSYIYKCDSTGENFNLVIELLEESFFAGLTYLSNRDCYLEAVKILGKLYLETQQYDLALNMMQMLVLKDSDVPDWVYLRFIFAQMHSDTAKRLIDEPIYVFDKLDRIDKTDEISVEQRNAVYQEFLIICTDFYKNGECDIDVDALFDKALEYGILHTDAWKELSSLFPEKFGTVPDISSDESMSESGDGYGEFEDEESNICLSASLIDDLEKENADLTQKIHDLQNQMAELLRKNQDYEHILAEKKAVIRRLTANEYRIDGLNKSLKNGQEKGHALLEGRKKILVIGRTDISTEKLTGVSKGYGYEKNDFVFWDDYGKIKSYAERLDCGTYSFSGIIAGPMPHKVSGLGECSSFIEKMKRPGFPHMEEARSENGELKLTKHSFRKALEKMTRYLMAIQ